MFTETSKKTVYIPSVPIPPGETLLEVLGNKGMTQAELAMRLNRPIKTVNEIIKGKASITAETAIQLEQVLGIGAHFWNNLEAIYREVKTRLEMKANYQSQIAEAKKFPYKEMAKWGWVPDTRNQLERVKNLLSFFAVTSFENIIEEKQLKGVFRISLKTTRSIPAITAWLRKGVVDSASIETKEFDRKKLISSLGEIRSLTRVDDPSQFTPGLQTLLVNCGVAFVVTPSLPKAPISGSARWLKPNKALIQLSLRYKFSDIFWFNLFHEIGHILFDKKRDFTVDFVNKEIQEEKERRADHFACDTLIPSDTYETLKNYFKSQNTYSNTYQEIKRFAEQIDIHPGIVTGRLQHDGLLPMEMNRLRVRFEWV